MGRPARRHPRPLPRPGQPGRPGAGPRPWLRGQSRDLGALGPAAGQGLPDRQPRPAGLRPDPRPRRLPPDRHRLRRHRRGGREPPEARPLHPGRQLHGRRGGLAVCAQTSRAPRSPGAGRRRRLPRAGPEGLARRLQDPAQPGRPLPAQGPRHHPGHRPGPALGLRADAGHGHRRHGRPLRRDEPRSRPQGHCPRHDERPGRPALRRPGEAGDDQGPDPDPARRHRPADQRRGRPQVRRRHPGLAADRLREDRPHPNGTGGRQVGRRPRCLAPGQGQGRSEALPVISAPSRRATSRARRSIMSGAFR